MKLYKLTDQDGYTRRGEFNETLWGENTTHKAQQEGTDLCSAEVIHAYTSPLIAVIMNRRHANLTSPLLWEAEGEVVANDGTKVGVKQLTTLRQIELPVLTTEQLVRFAIYCALEVCNGLGFVTWANAWLDGTDRSYESARTARRAADAAYAAAYAAADAAYAADTAAAYAAADAAYAAADAADAAAKRNTTIDLYSLAVKALQEVAA